ncbi:MAG: cysteine desulfurase [Dyadobacter sp. 50-39]|uniref:cysteine desulfurase family protein n=1 Tax=Dyadobacter sp. 50-39 TaxID=1895756 RepID=UPI00095A22C0|nr:cysteine desulfurase family protein [Dyadobacter sp. 50-39]OJV21874.1 MAG: cysteine desulfurase [Dyadobacter sp. 50-39]
MEIYLDNAATTAPDPEVIEAILPFLTTHYANPSSAHAAGKRVKEAVDQARRTVAHWLGASPEEIYFTAGATEGINLTLSGAIQAYDLNHAITSRIEHKAVLQTLKRHEKEGDIETSFVKLDERGNVDLYHLENLLRANPRTLIALMHGNNEIGNLTDIHAIAVLAKRYNAVFFTDTTQTVGKEHFDLQDAGIDFLVGSAHKFHGPKGAGFVYINRKHQLKPLIYGGGQERGQRGGTENVIGIVGLAKALEISYRHLEATRNKVSKLKQYLVSKLAISGIEGICYNGESKSVENSVPNVLNVSFPCLGTGSIVAKLDQLGIGVSGGSACQGGGASHVMQALACEANKENVRFSFSKFNTFEELDHVVEAIVRIYESDPAAATHKAWKRIASWA